MVGIECVSMKLQVFIEQLEEEGLIITMRPATVIRLLPPLIVTK